MAAPSRRVLWIAVALAAVAAVLAYRHFELGRWLTLDQLKASRDALVGAYQAQPLTIVAAYFAVYVTATALSIPGAAVLTLAAGAMFGLGLGLLVVSFASSLGALLAFLASRYLLRDSPKVLSEYAILVWLRAIVCLVGACRVLRNFYT